MRRVDHHDPFEILLTATGNRANLERDLTKCQPSLFLRHT